MEFEKNQAPDMEGTVAVRGVDAGRLKKFTQVLHDYNAGKSGTIERIKASEQWWKLRNSTEEMKVTNIGADGGFKSVSGWLHNVIVSKHADAMESYPEPNILPREVGDKEEAKSLSDVVPCVMEQNEFEETYSDASWQKLKTGTGAYKIIWDQDKLNGLGDIAIAQLNLLNLYWEPGVTDIQKSRYVFQTELMDKDLLEGMYPQLTGKLKGKGFMSAQFLYDDSVSTANKMTVIEVYYHTYVGPRKVLHYCKYVGDQVLESTENDPNLRLTGLYDHGLFPYVLDPLFPIEGSPCGYGFVDVCRNPQITIDLLNTAFVKNAMVGATPRYFSRGDGSVNEEEFLDLSKPIVHARSVDELALRRIEHTPLDGMYVNVLDRTVNELRETSGNTETSTGNVSSGVTAASAIAALQEASGKGSRDSTQASYRAYSKIVYMVIELIRQFYDLPRKFRITGQYGAQEFITYSNKGIKPKHQGVDFGVDMGYRKPVFDIKVSAQKRNVYTKMTQNELALQFFKMGFFNPQQVDQSLMCLEMMEFEGKDELMQKISSMGTMFQKLVQYMQLALTMASVTRPDIAEQIAQDIMQTMGTMGGTAPGGGGTLMTADHIAGDGKKENAVVSNSRQRTAEATQPNAGRVIAERKK